MSRAIEAEELVAYLYLPDFVQTFHKKGKFPQDWPSVRQETEMKLATSNLDEELQPNVILQSEYDKSEQNSPNNERKMVEARATVSKRQIIKQRVVDA